MTAHGSRRAQAALLPTLASLFLAAPPGEVEAANLKVPRDYATLADAIVAATPGLDEIWVSAWADSADTAGNTVYYLDPTLYRLDSTLVLGDGLIYRGGWDATYTAQSSETRIYLAEDSTGSVIDASLTSPSVTFTNFTVGPPVKPVAGITQQGGGLFVADGSLLVANCLFENNVSTVSGGAVQVGSGSAAHIRDCTFRENATGFTAGSGRGGAVAVGTGAGGVFLENCRFENNAADSAGAFNSAAGGAVFTASPIRMERCKFVDNFSGTDGGAFYARNADAHGWGNLFYSNRAGRNGGAIYYQNGSGELDASLVEDCIAGTRGAGSGGGVCFEGGSNRFFDGYVRRCEALGAGGDGYTQGAGGGFYLIRPDPGTAVRRTEIVGNRAELGGGLLIQGMTDGTFSDADVTENTIVANFAAIADTAMGRATAGGVHVLDNFLGELVNNILAEQEDGCGIACESRFGGTLPSPNIRFNCVWNGPGNADPGYGGLCVDRTGDNGNIAVNPGLCCFVSTCVGVTQPDLRLTTASPCLGAGEGGVDLGAHPGASACPPPTSLEPSSWGAIKARYR